MSAMVRPAAALPGPALVWRKSGRSNGNGGNNCVEVAFARAGADGLVGVRDSKNPHGPAVFFTDGQWRSFIAGAKSGHFDRRH